MQIGKALIEHLEIYQNVFEILTMNVCESEGRIRKKFLLINSFIAAFHSIDIISRLPQNLFYLP